MVEWFKRLAERPAVAHLLRAGLRFLTRLGFQFSAAITYFSVLALVPILMFAFSFTGFFLVRLRPDLIPKVAQAITAQLKGVDETAVQQFTAFITDTLSNYTAIGIAGLLAALYSGAGWMNNLRDAINTQWRAEFEDAGPQPNPVLKTLTSLVALLGLIGAIAVTFGLASLSTSWTDQIIAWLGLPQSRVFSLVPVVFSIAAGWLTFCYIFVVLPQHRQPWRAVRVGALMGTVGLFALQYLASFLISLLSRNLAARFFGPIIILMLFFNFFATLILFVAAWIATYDQPAFAEPEEKVRFAVSPTEPGPPESATAGAPEPASTGPGATGPATVSREVAVRSLRIGTGAGYVTGAATGLGLGAVLVALAARIVRRRH